MKALVFDIGGTAIKYGFCQDGELTRTQETATQAHLGGRHILDTISSLAEAFSGYDAIGISTAGQVDSRQGTILYANSNIPDYTGMLLRRELEERFRVPVMVENDVNCAAAGEAAFGAGREYQDFLCLTYGTGVGGAIILNQQLYHGSSFIAGEFGGIVTHGDRRLSEINTDPYAGCYERYASTTALVRSLQSYDSSLDSGRRIFERLNDPAVREFIDDWIGEILLGLISLIHIFNPPCVVLGGGIMSQPYITEEIRRRLPGLLLPSFADVRIEPARLGNHAGLLGIYTLTKNMCNGC